MSLKNPVTPPGIDRGTVRVVAQRIDHYDTPGPNQQVHFNIYGTFYSQYSHERVSAGIPDIFRVLFLLQGYNYG
jgi:hypothetical protein